MSKNSQNPFRLNVGFIVAQSVGYNREFVFDETRVFIPPDLELFDVQGVVEVTRTSQGLLVEARLEGALTAECARCLNDFRQELAIDFTELYAFTAKSLTESNLLVPENGQIDLAPLVREEFLLAVPIRPLCQADCKGLCPICGENRNEVECNHEDEAGDPRMQVLKSLLKKE